MRIAAILLATGCTVIPPPPAMAGELTDCHPGSYGALSELTCERDSDCLLCASASAPCGRLTSRERMELTGEACPSPDYEACHDAHAACCEGRCVRSLGPPGF